MAKLLQQWVTAQAERRPEALALVAERASATYGELEALSNRIARMLKAAGAARGDRVGFLIPKSPAAVAAMLGTLKADCAYVPLDPAGPAPRLKKILEACASRWILAAGPVAPMLDEILRERELRAAISVGWLDGEKPRGENFAASFALGDLAAYSSLPPDYENDESDPAHILFTSGSTGAPKGVVITHANVIRFIEWANDYFGLESSDRLSGHTPLHFDLSMFDVYGTLAAGAELHMIAPELSLLPNKLVEFIRAARLTQWFSVPSILNYLAKFDAVRQDDFPALKRLLWCGEVFPTPALIYWMKRLPHVRFTNLYGPTEATIASSYYTVPACPEDPQAAIPIGAPCAGEELLVLDERLEPVAPGEIGDLYIAGAGLSPGYWRDEEKTRAAFLPDPRRADAAARIYRTGDLARAGADGQIYFLGRADSQIKSRGYRIELGEIEAALNALGLVQECAVVAVTVDGFEGSKICCACVPAADRAVTPATLRKELARLLPSYMLPAGWLIMESLPKNPNGKIDRPRLAREFKEHEIAAA